MDQKIQTSFIPKRQSEARSSVSKAKRPLTLFNWLSVLIFILAVLLTVGMFAYEYLTLRQHRAKALIIEREIQAFDAELTERLGRVKSRIDLGKRFLTDHLALSSFFSLIEESTVRNIYFYEFDLEASPGGRASFKAKGEAPSYAVLNFQSKVLNESELFLSSNFLGMNLNERGAVNFELVAEVSAKAASYRDKLESSAQPAEQGSGQPVGEQEEQEMDEEEENGTGS